MPGGWFGHSLQGGVGCWGTGEVDWSQILRTLSVRLGNVEAGRYLARLDSCHLREALPPSLGT